MNPVSATPSSSAEGRRLLSDAVIITAAPALAYVSSFAFEAGYVRMFGIPLELINVDLRTVLLMGAFLFMAYNILTPALQFVPRRPAKVMVSILFWGAAVVALDYVAWKATVGHPLWQVVALVIVGITNLGYLQELHGIFFRKKLGNTWLDRWEKLRQVSQDADAKRYQTSVLYSFHQLIDPTGRFVRAGILLIILLACLNLAGALSANLQRQFLVSETNPPLAMIRRYGDFVIAAPFDSSTKHLKETFVLMRLAVDSGTTWKLERIGPLSAPAETRALKIR